MADNYGGVDGHLRAQRAIPASQKATALDEVEKVIKKARGKYVKSGSRRDADDLAGAEAMRNKIKEWETE